MLRPIHALLAHGPQIAAPAAEGRRACRAAEGAGDRLLGCGHAPIAPARRSVKGTRRSVRSVRNASTRSAWPNNASSRFFAGDCLGGLVGAVRSVPMGRRRSRGIARGH